MKIDVCTGKEVYERELYKRPILGSFVDETSNAQASEHRVLSYEMRSIYMEKYLEKKTYTRDVFQALLSTKQATYADLSLQHCHMKRDLSI